MMWNLLFPILDKVLGAVLPDPQAKAKAITDILGELGKLDQGQLEVNKTEAAHRSIFVAGWRPMIGWCCAFAVGYQYILLPLISWVAAVFALPIPPLPGLDDNLWELTMGLLGLGSLRTFEKIKGVAK
jgi:hypothetical protein